jgi:hypothetical protein
MKGIKVNMDMVNCGLLLVVLALVVMCCVNRESFAPTLPGEGFGKAGFGPKGVQYQGQKEGVFEGGMMYGQASKPNYTRYQKTRR